MFYIKKKAAKIFVDNNHLSLTLQDFVCMLFILPWNKS